MASCLSLEVQMGAWGESLARETKPEDEGREVLTGVSSWAKLSVLRKSPVGPGWSGV